MICHALLAETLFDRTRTDISGRHHGLRPQSESPAGLNRSRRLSGSGRLKLWSCGRASARSGLGGRRSGPHGLLEAARSEARGLCDLRTRVLRLGPGSIGGPSKCGGLERAATGGLRHGTLGEIRRSTAASPTGRTPTARANSPRCGSRRGLLRRLTASSLRGFLRIPLVAFKKSGGEFWVTSGEDGVSG